MYRQPECRGRDIGADEEIDTRWRLIGGIG
jgi:hypothetical protein